MAEDKSGILQGTLDLMVLKTLDTLGPLHGYPSLTRLLQKKWISAAWGTSENNRKAKFYSITKAGRKQLAQEARSWERISGVIGRVLRSAERG